MASEVAGLSPRMLAVAVLEDLIAEVEDPRLRAALAAEARELKQRTTFGLVFERHLPESVVLASKIGVAVGAEVRLRSEPSDGRRLRVTDLVGQTATLTDAEGCVDLRRAVVVT